MVGSWHTLHYRENWWEKVWDAGACISLHPFNSVQPMTSGTRAYDQQAAQKAACHVEKRHMQSWRQQSRGVKRRAQQQQQQQQQQQSTTDLVSDFHAHHELVRVHRG